MVDIKECVDSVEINNKSRHFTLLLPSISCVCEAKEQESRKSLCSALPRCGKCVIRPAQKLAPAAGLGIRFSQSAGYLNNRDWHVILSFVFNGATWWQGKSWLETIYLHGSPCRLQLRAQRYVLPRPLVLPSFSSSSHDNILTPNTAICQHRPTCFPKLVCLSLTWSVHLTSMVFPVTT